MATCWLWEVTLGLGGRLWTCRGQDAETTSFGRLGRRRYLCLLGDNGGAN